MRVYDERKFGQGCTMARLNAGDNFDEVQKRVVELAIQLGVLFILVLWCFRIIEPFVLLVAWAAIVAIALYPVFRRLAGWLGGRTRLAAASLVVILLTLLIAPAAMLTESLVIGTQALAKAGGSGELAIPPPPDNVLNWPVVGEDAHNLWGRAANDLGDVLKDFAPQIETIASWLLQSVTGTGIGILQFIVAFIISGILLTTADKGVAAAQAFATRLAPQRGPEFAALATSTIRNVALGIVGVSMVQTALLSAGFLVIGMPVAGLAALLVLILCIVQIGPGLVTIPAIIYAFSVLDTLPAVLFTVWTVVMSLIDSVLKPMVFGRGAAVPTLVIFLGAIGGLVAYGIIGLFVGAIVLSLGFKLYEAWLRETPRRPAAKPSDHAQDAEELEADYNV
jgi:predicted PurR-regulated permease PerM